MAFVLSTNKLNQFYGMTHFAHKPYYNQLDIQCTRRLFILTVSRPSPQGRCFIELRLAARFFSHYDIGSDDDQITLHRTISPQLFFTTFLQMRRSGFDFMMLYLTHHLDTLILSFSNLSDPHDPPHYVYLPFLLTYQDFDLYRTLSTTGVVFPSHPLQSMLATLNNDSHVTFTVTLTTTQAKFTAKDHMGRDVGFILSVQREECIIEGVIEGEETEIVIVLNPIESFNNIISLANPTNFWVGIGKSNNNNNRGVINIRKGLYTKYMFYSSE